MSANKRPLAEVVSLAEWREEHTPHLSGKAVCLSCKHRWVAVAPAGSLWLECPKCRHDWGRYVEHVQREGPHWHCACGNDLFYVTPEGSYCPMCGVWTKGAVE